jgi:hypothetical protein
LVLSLNNKTIEGYILLPLKRNIKDWLAVTGIFIFNHKMEKMGVFQNEVQTWKVLLKILIFEVLSLTAYSPSEDQTISSAEPNDLFLHAKAVYIIYSPSPQTTTNLPFGLCLKL